MCNGPYNGNPLNVVTAKHLNYKITVELYICIYCMCVQSAIGNQYGIV